MNIYVSQALSIVILDVYFLIPKKVDTAVHMENY